MKVHYYLLLIFAIVSITPKAYSLNIVRDVVGGAVDVARNATDAAVDIAEHTTDVAADIVTGPRRDVIVERPVEIVRPDYQTVDEYTVVEPQSDELITEPIYSEDLQ